MKSSLSALKCVSNGLAAAPPALETRIGVSTSMNPCPSKYFLIALRILERLINVSLTSGFMISLHISDGNVNLYWSDRGISQEGSEDSSITMSLPAHG